jgi:hypothetical protein
VVVVIARNRSRADQWAREMENVRATLLPGGKPQ